MRGVGCSEPHRAPARGCCAAASILRADECQCPACCRLHPCGQEALTVGDDRQNLETGSYRFFRGSEDQNACHFGSTSAVRYDRSCSAAFCAGSWSILSFLDVSEERRKAGAVRRKVPERTS